MTDDNPKAADWKSDVMHAVADAYDGPLVEGPLALRVEFFMVRPKGHYRSGRNSHLLRDSAPQAPDVKPDLLKLTRGLEDALTGQIWKDDAQIVQEELSKNYGPKPGASVMVFALDSEDAGSTGSPSHAQAAVGMLFGSSTIDGLDGLFEE